jgi:7-cyano-7-deazaguanine synthase
MIISAGRGVDRKPGGSSRALCIGHWDAPHTLLHENRGLNRPSSSDWKSGLSPGTARFSIRGVNRTRKVVVLCSGGMDSVTALHATRTEGHEIVCVLSFHYGSKHNDREIPCAAYHCARLGLRHEVIRLDFVDRLFDSALLRSGGAVPDGHYEEQTMRQTVVPFRNGIMLAVAAGCAESAGASAVVIAAHAGDHAIYPDCREPFMQAMTDAIRLGTYAGIEVLRPFISLNKAEIAARGAALGVDFARTWSCYKGGDIHCGRCGTCVERREAFLVAGLTDPTVYADCGPLPPKPAPV